MHTFRWPEKLLIRHRKYPSKEDYYTLHSEDQLPLCPRRGYFGITPVQFPYKQSFDIVGSCNGILCLFENGNTRNISLWNPSIRRKLPVPGCPQIFATRIHFGFGFDPINNDYKIVRVFNSLHGGSPKSSFVYSMKKGSWCAITSNPKPFKWCDANSKACCVNGILHWVIINHLVKPGFCIMTFDLSSHVFGIIELPETTRYKSIHLTIIKGFLAAISMDPGDCSIWVRRDSSWSVFLESKVTQLFEGTLVNVLKPCSDCDLLFRTHHEGFQVFNRKFGYLQSRLVDFTAASFRIIEMEMCSESLGSLDIAIGCEGN
ncbi:hypothetical protein L2E82_03257 [Cichorium intybus]|uniref:Uncharacterized protein n=1 Tax=Cichorium intybus TaxID=13427 RepID=A0ACB9H461_CICIN|nr:hypothetical protein L2E82_03257 [Cichorium intybus]